MNEWKNSYSLSHPPYIYQSISYQLSKSSGDPVYGVSGPATPHRQAGSQPLTFPFDCLSTTHEVWRPRSIILYDYELPMHRFTMINTSPVYPSPLTSYPAYVPTAGRHSTSYRSTTHQLSISCRTISFLSILYDNKLGKPDV